MSSTTQALGTFTLIGAGSLDAIGTLASGRNCITDIVTLGGALDLILEIKATATGTPSGNKQLSVWAIPSVDGTNYTNVPTSNTDTTQDDALQNPLANIPFPAVSNQPITFYINLRQALRGGPVPASVKFLVRNDLGVTLSSGSISYRAVTLSAT